MAADPLATAMADVMQVTDPAELRRLKDFIDARLMQLTPSQPVNPPPPTPPSPASLIVVGDRVVLTGLTPAYVNGSRAVVVGIKKSKGRHPLKAGINFENPSSRVADRFGGRTVWVPVTRLIKVQS